MSVSVSPATLRSRFPAATVVVPEPSLVARAGAILLPLVLLLAWTAAIRLPFYIQTDKDEFFFSIIAAQWAKGHLPYVATFDLKPPGLFFLYLIVQGVFGASQATVKGMEVVAVGVAAWLLYLTVRRHGSARAAIWAAVILPVYTMALGGSIAVNMLLQLPFVVAAFAAILNATAADAGRGERMLNALLAGLAIGYAGMIKQTAAFEALALFAILWIYGARGSRLGMSALFVAGAAIPAAGFVLYFVGVGHFREMFDAVIMLSLERASADVAASYGPEFQRFFTPLGILENAFVSSGPLVFLVGGALFVPLRYGRIVATIPPRLIWVAVLWLAAAFAGVLYGRVLSSYYCLTMMPPLVILSAATFAHGLDVRPARARLAFILSIVVGIGCLVFVERINLFTPNAFLAGDYAAERRVSAEIAALRPRPDDRLFVLNRGFSVYTETGLLPPTPVFHATHLLGVFPTPSSDPLGEALAANPRFVVVADPSIWHITELESRYRQVQDYLDAHYRRAAVIEGAKDTFFLYEYAG